jgi:hypothetical protein
VAARECHRARCTSMSSNDSNIVPVPSSELGPCGCLCAQMQQVLPVMNIRERQVVAPREEQQKVVGTQNRRRC